MGAGYQSLKRAVVASVAICAAAVLIVCAGCSQGSGTIRISDTKVLTTDQLAAIRTETAWKSAAKREQWRKFVELSMMQVLLSERQFAVPLFYNHTRMIRVLRAPVEQPQVEGAPEQPPVIPDDAMDRIVLNDTMTMGPFAMPVWRSKQVQFDDSGKNVGDRRLALYAWGILWLDHKVQEPASEMSYSHTAGILWSGFGYTKRQTALESKTYARLFWFRIPLCD